MNEKQSKLDIDQISEFYIDVFVQSQLSHFESVLPKEVLSLDKAIVDVGGGCGYFARALGDSYGKSVRVVDMDPQSIEMCEKLGVVGTLGDATNPVAEGDEEVVCLNLILHHLVGDNENATRQLQKSALLGWLGKSKYIFVNEYIYESYVRNFSGYLIYTITRSKLLSAIGSFVSKFVPSLRANTFGVGVRFRAHNEWSELFEECGFKVVTKILGENERLSLAHRILFIDKIRRDSFLLAPSTGLPDETRYEPACL